MLVLKHQTKAELAARIRAAYKDSSRERTAKIATFILNHIDAGDFTETEVRNVFGLSAGQWNTLKTKMENLRTAYFSVDAAGGE